MRAEARTCARADTAGAGNFDEANKKFTTCGTQKRLVGRMPANSRNGCLRREHELINSPSPFVTTSKHKKAKIPNDVRKGEAWAKWRGAAERFQGIGERLEAQIHLRNIRLQPDGFQVVFSQKGNYLSRHFGGHDEAALQRAIRFRDEEARKRAGVRKNRVPTKVLRALGLSAEVIGITRLPSRSVYRVSSRSQRRAAMQAVLLPLRARGGCVRRGDRIPPRARSASAVKPAGSLAMRPACTGARCYSCGGG